MNHHAGTIKGSSLRIALADLLRESEERAAREAAEDRPWHEPLTKRLPRWSRVLDVSIAATVAYFWL